MPPLEFDTQVSGRDLHVVILSMFPSEGDQDAGPDEIEVLDEEGDVVTLNSTDEDVVRAKCCDVLATHGRDDENIDEDSDVETDLDAGVPNGHN